MRPIRNIYGAQFVYYEAILYNIFSIITFAEGNFNEDICLFTNT